MVTGKKQSQTFSGYYSTKYAALKSGFYETAQAVVTVHGLDP